MRVVEQSVQVRGTVDGQRILESIEEAGRTCYKSEDRITKGSAEKFVAMLIKNGHEAMIEHESISVRFITDRGVTHEIVRHRLAAYAQESTRYCNYGKAGEVVFIKPIGFDDWTPSAKTVWHDAMHDSEQAYMDLLAQGLTAQFARAVLPNSLKTEIVMTANLREWRHFFKLRAAKGAHPQMKALASDCLNQFKALVPVVFDDIEEG